jgi:hypothetical protein
MSCCSRPSDPVAGPAPPPGASAPPASAPRPSDAAAAQPADEAVPEEEGICGEGVVAPCPCANAEITSETVMTEPANRARTRLGVGERVRVTFSLGSATWTLTGRGRLSSTNGATITYTAPAVSGDVTLTATGSGCNATISFTIVVPDSVHMTRHHPGQVEHTQTFPDIGMLTRIFLGPDDVNFYRVQFLELEIACTATGVHSCHNGSGHFPNANGLGATTHVVAGRGTRMNAVDHVYSGHCGNPWAAPQVGRMHWPIPWRYRVGNGGAWHRLTRVHQRIRCEATGRLTATKAGASAHAQAGDATSAP